ncbi:glycosyltransferase family 2 protein [Rhodopirellula bahusiensis]|uniref:glycosyltransferase family 2 protein n=1 Tax=Rhodopirellula bahusiensis TaxID=2014065 RepID=UPI0032667B92
MTPLKKQCSFKKALATACMAATIHPTEAARDIKATLDQADGAMKLVIQIPCLNEAGQLPGTLLELPKQLSGFDEVIVLVIDDGSTDDTAAVAREHGVEWLIRHRRNRGLASAFTSGLEASLRLGADVIVNTDADGQYPASEIPKLVAPILLGKADLVIGDRRPGENKGFPLHKRFLQRVGSKLVSRLAGAEIPDAVSGFRALSRDAALQTSVLTSFSYTIETVLQSCHNGLSVVSVPISTRRTIRPSRLFRSLPQFLIRSGMTILSLQVRYRPLAFLVPSACVFFLAGCLPVARFLYLSGIGRGDGHVQSLVLGGVCLLASLLLLGLAVLAHLCAVNRSILERMEYLRRKSLDVISSRDLAAPAVEGSILPVNARAVSHG